MNFKPRNPKGIQTQSPGLPSIGQSGSDRGYPGIEASELYNPNEVAPIGPPSVHRLRLSSAALCFWAIALLAATSCCCGSPAPPLARFSFTNPHMGTLFSITLYATNETSAKAAADAAFHRIAALEEVMSDYRADSELMRLCDQPFGKPVPISQDLLDVFTRSQETSKLTDGAFDITIGPCVRLWRFSRKRKTLPTAEELSAARAAVGWKNLRLDARARTATLLLPNMRLDLGGLGKGFAADEALKILKGRGIDRALVAASGDIAIGDAPPGETGWKVGISGIDVQTNDTAHALLLHNCGISTSGDTEQFVEINGVRYSHIVDPATCLGLTNRIQDTIIGPNATTTDGLDTALSVMDVQRGLKLVDSMPDAAALFLKKDKGQTDAFPSRQFKKRFPDFSPN
jgi:thiamine biosynthesis lipoprotein